VSAADRPIRILLVEDSDVYRDSLVFLLGSRADLEIVAAVGDGAAAVRACREHVPDVVVLDYRLPDVDGATVARELVGPPVVFLSASAGRAEYDAASSAGAALVRKDEGIEALVRAVRTAAGR
jgi:DNA-binding NarL/FixJ family response regulator